MQVKKTEAAKLTFFCNQRPATEEKQIDGVLSAPEVTANVVDVFEKTSVILNKVIFTSRVKMFEFCLDTFALAFSAPEEVDARLLCLFGELSERRLSDTTCCTYKDCNEPSRETGSDSGVGITHQVEGNHDEKLGISPCVKVHSIRRRKREGELSAINRTCQQRLETVYPPHWTHQYPACCICQLSTDYKCSRANKVLVHERKIPTFESTISSNSKLAIRPDKQNKYFTYYT